MLTMVFRGKRPSMWLRVERRNCVAELVSFGLVTREPLVLVTSDILPT